MTIASTALSDIDIDMKKILFVCTGNTCRSPMAQEIFNDLAPEGYKASSAGITATDGRKISENSLAALKEIGLSCTHTSERLTEDHMKEYDIIVGITSDHARVITQLYPDYRDKIFAFPCDVSDPYGGDIVLYRRCRDKITEGVKSIIEALKNE